MKNIIAFAASSSRNSINKQLAEYAANQLTDIRVTLLDLNDFEMPIYSIDRENENGIPELAKRFKQHIQEADGIIISFAEHNGAYSAAFKNIYDWVSRMDGSVWEDKPMLLMASSPGGRGGLSVLELALGHYGRSNKKITGSFSLPNFYDNFSQTEGVKDEELAATLKTELKKFQEAL